MRTKKLQAGVLDERCTILKIMPKIDQSPFSKRSRGVFYGIIFNFNGEPKCRENMMPDCTIRFDYSCLKNFGPGFLTRKQVPTKL